MTERQQATEPYVLVIRFGYYSTPVETLGHLARTLGEVLDGEILAYGRAECAQLGRFKIRSWKTSPQHPMRERIRFFLGVLLRALHVSWVLRRRLVIVAYDPFQSGLLGLVARALTGAKLVVEVNGDFSNPLALSTPGRSRRAVARRLTIGRFVLRRAQVVKLLFEGQLSGLRISVPQSRTAVFFNLIDTSTFAVPARPREPFLLFAGHPLYIKGGDVLLRAFAEVSYEFPEWRMLMVGFRVAEHARASGFPVGPRVDFYPPQSPSALAELMARCGAFVLPSRTEGMGRVLVEAATAGAPRVATRVGGIPSVVQDGVDGLLVAPENVAALSDALRQIMSNSATRARMSENARIRACSAFTPAVYKTAFTALAWRALDA